MTRETMLRRATRSFLLALAPIVIFWTPARAAASAEMRADFTAWYGCWEPVAADAAENVVVCILPADAASVRMVTIADGRITEESTLHADGVARPVSEGGCTGQESARWSRDARRIFVRTELACGAASRVSTSVLAFVAVNEFIDAQAVTVSGEHAARAVRYRALPAGRVPAVVASALAADRSLAAQTARIDAAMPLAIDDVIEAAGAVAPPALEAMLAAREQAFALDARTLVRLEEAGVPRSVMNVMIAVSYPKHFALQQPAQVEDRTARADRRDECWDPYFLMYRPCAFVYGAVRYGYNRYGYRSRYGYGYGGYGYDLPWAPGWSDRPVVIIVRDGEIQRPGAVIKGQGYTSGTAPRTGSAEPRSGSSTTSSGNPAPPATSSGSGSTGTSTSSGSGTSTGRTAIPRGGGGGETSPRSEIATAPRNAPTAAPRTPPPVTPRSTPTATSGAAAPRTAAPRPAPPPAPRAQPAAPVTQPAAPPPVTTGTSGSAAPRTAVPRPAGGGA